MASNHTPNLNLSQWTEEDLVLREDFNADNEKIDAAVSAANARINSVSTAATAKIDAASAAATAKVNAASAELNTKIDTSIAAVNKKIDSAVSDTNAKITSASNTASASLTSAVNTINSRIDTVSSNLTTKINAADDRIDDVISDTNSKINTAKSQLNTAIAAKCQMLVGSYTGDGAESRTIQLGVTPKFVWVWPANTTFPFPNQFDAHSAMIITGKPAKLDGQTVMQIVNNGFTVACKLGMDDGYDIVTNMSKTNYCYLALA